MQRCDYRLAFLSSGERSCCKSLPSLYPFMLYTQDPLHYSSGIHRIAPIYIRFFYWVSKTVVECGPITRPPLLPPSLWTLLERCENQKHDLYEGRMHLMTSPLRLPRPPYQLVLTT
ncbi:hypothetical protein PILCRDRAFT_328550 [Piloderma croceum F 1598]|uniref:Uncharacterized protein n=1 Tax=Piloderma croceum (strain F 1598) TaxID=765440 RepID=A0A0C3G1Y8_PILCF|nr:hypothetical protein PILCRDRAFT_328550 [Piloderma croceum F 1598]